MLPGGLPGAAAGFFGHLFSALLSGFPLTLPLHLVIAAEMGLTCLAVGAVLAADIPDGYDYNGGLHRASDPGLEQAELLESGLLANRQGGLPVDMIGGKAVQERRTGA